ncbi:MAG TPA: hypothetical protein VGC65_00245 [Bacteroidia bacterium]|jgi:hypothetical protein
MAKKAVKKTAPKKVAKKATTKAVVKKAVKKSVVKAPQKQAKVSAKKVGAVSESLSAKEADQVVVIMIKGKLNEAKTAAITIAGEMGPGYFTIHEMVKKSREGKLVIYKNTAHPSMPQKMSWTDAKNAILNIYKFGLIESHPEIKECFRVRLDKQFRIDYFQNQKELLVTKMSDANISISVIQAEEEVKSPATKLDVVK